MSLNCKRVVITGASFPSTAMQRLRDHDLDVERLPGDLDADGVAAALDGAWGYVLGGSERIPSGIWRQLPDLRVVCVLATGYRSFIEPPDGPTDTVFTFTPHANAEAVAEFTVALALDRVRSMSTRAAEVAAGHWSEATTGSLLGARIGVAGMGHIGRAVARMLNAAFGADIVYWNRTPRPELRDAGYTASSSLVELCEQVDVLVLTMAHIPGSNDGIVGKRELEALGERGVVVNTAAPGLIEPDVLRWALVSGTIAAAALDGYYQEPTPEPERDPHGLLELAPRLLVTPHCASLTHQAMEGMAEMATTNVLAVLAGHAPPHAIPLDPPGAVHTPVTEAAS
jgi:phosphoglycerate dehydrogenase-like enzyme